MVAAEKGVMTIVRQSPHDPLRELYKGLIMNNAVAGRSSLSSNIMGGTTVDNSMLNQSGRGSQVVRHLGKAVSQDTQVQSCYQNVDFVAVPEPYKVVTASRLHN